MVPTDWGIAPTSWAPRSESDRILRQPATRRQRRLTRIFHENDQRLGEAPEQKRPKATEVCFSAHRRESEAVYARRFAQDLVEFREIFGSSLAPHSFSPEPPAKAKEPRLR